MYVAVSENHVLVPRTPFTTLQPADTYNTGMFYPIRIHKKICPPKNNWPVDPLSVVVWAERVDLTGTRRPGRPRQCQMALTVKSSHLLNFQKKTLKTGGREFWNTFYCFDCLLLPNLPELHLLLHFKQFSLNVYIFVLQLSIFAQRLYGKEEARLYCLQIEALY